MHTVEAYKILELGYDVSSLTQIKDAFRRQSLLHHPDKVGNSEESHENMARINLAYELLKDNWDKEQEIKEHEQSVTTSDVQREEVGKRQANNVQTEKKAGGSMWANDGSRERPNMPFAPTQVDLGNLLDECDGVTLRLHKIQAATKKRPCPGINVWELRYYLDQQQGWMRDITAWMESEEEIGPSNMEEFAKIRRLTGDTKTIFNWFDKLLERTIKK
ncbi:hypothetical protein F5X99DRAFT_424997 [Biscogniauxia marginata]|nr:hypothetical protein F5X99DRAFT_424997 [Biscogniauxia marginata]